MKLSLPKTRMEGINKKSVEGENPNLREELTGLSEQTRGDLLDEDLIHCFQKFEMAWRMRYTSRYGAFHLI